MQGIDWNQEMFNTYRDTTGCYGDLNVESYSQNVDDSEKVASTSGSGLSTWNTHVSGPTTHSTAHGSHPGHVSHATSSSQYHSAFHHHTANPAMDPYGYSLSQVPHKETEPVAGKDLLRSSSPAPPTAAVGAAWQASRSRARYPSAVTGGAFLPYQAQANHYEAPALEVGPHGGMPPQAAHPPHAAHRHALGPRKQPWAGESAFAAAASVPYQRDAAALMYGEDVRGAGGIVRHTAGLEARGGAQHQQQHHVPPQSILHQQHQHSAPHHQLFRQLVQKEREAHRLPGYHDAVREAVARTRYPPYHEALYGQHQQFCNSTEMLRKGPLPMDGDRRSAFTARQSSSSASYNPSWNKNTVGPYVPFHPPQMLPSHRSSGSAFQPCSKVAEPEMYPSDSLLWPKAGQVEHGAQVQGHWVHDAQSQMFLPRHMGKQAAMAASSASMLGPDAGQLDALQSAAGRPAVGMNVAAPNAVPVVYTQHQRLDLHAAHLRSQMMHHQQQAMQRPVIMPQHSSPMAISQHSAHAQHSPVVASPHGSVHSPLVAGPCPQQPQQPQQLQHQQDPLEAEPQHDEDKASRVTSRSLRNCQDVRQFLATWDEDADVGTPRPCTEEVDNADPEEGPLVVLDCRALPREEAANLLNMYPGVNINSVPETLLTCGGEGMFGTTTDTAQGVLQNLLESACGTNSGSNSTTIASPVTSPIGQSGARSLDMLLNAALPTPPASQEHNVAQINVPVSTPVTEVNLSSPVEKLIEPIRQPKMDAFGFELLSPASPTPSVKFTSMTVNTPFVRFPLVDDPPSVIQSSKDHVGFSATQPFSCDEGDHNAMDKARRSVPGSMPMLTDDLTTASPLAPTSSPAPSACAETKTAASTKNSRKRETSHQGHSNEAHDSSNSHSLDAFGTHTRTPSTNQSEAAEDRSKWAFAQISKCVQPPSHDDPRPSSSIIKTLHNWEISDFPGMQKYKEKPSSNSSQLMVDKGTAPVTCVVESQKSDSQRYDKSTSPTVFLTNKDTQTEEMRQSRKSADPSVFNDTFAQTSVRCIQDELQNDSYAQTSVRCLQDDIHFESIAPEKSTCNVLGEKLFPKKIESSTGIENLDEQSETGVALFLEEPNTHHINIIYNENLMSNTSEVAKEVSIKAGACLGTGVLFSETLDVSVTHKTTTGKEMSEKTYEMPYSEKESGITVRETVGAMPPMPVLETDNSCIVRKESRVQSDPLPPESENRDIIDGTICGQNAQENIQCETEKAAPVKQNIERNRSVGTGTEDKYLSRIVDLSPGNIPKILLQRLKENSSKKNGVIKRLPSIRLTRVCSPMSSSSSEPEYVCSVSNTEEVATTVMDSVFSDHSIDHNGGSPATFYKKKRAKLRNIAVQYSTNSTLQEECSQSIQNEMKNRGPLELKSTEPHEHAKILGSLPSDHHVLLKTQDCSHFKTHVAECGDEEKNIIHEVMSDILFEVEKNENQSSTLEKIANLRDTICPQGCTIPQENVLASEDDTPTSCVPSVELPLVTTKEKEIVMHIPIDVKETADFECSPSRNQSSEKEKSISFVADLPIDTLSREDIGNQPTPEDYKKTFVQATVQNPGSEATAESLRPTDLITVHAKDYEPCKIPRNKKELAIVQKARSALYKEEKLYSLNLPSQENTIEIAKENIPMIEEENSTIQKYDRSILIAGEQSSLAKRNDPTTDLLEIVPANSEKGTNEVDRVTKNISTAEINELIADLPELAPGNSNENVTEADRDADGTQEPVEYTNQEIDNSSPQDPLQHQRIEDHDGAMPVDSNLLDNIICKAGVGKNPVAPEGFAKDDSASPKKLVCSVSGDVCEEISTACSLLNEDNICGNQSEGKKDFDECVNEALVCREDKVVCHSSKDNTANGSALSEGESIANDATLNDALNDTPKLPYGVENIQIDSYSKSPVCNSSVEDSSYTCIGLDVESHLQPVICCYEFPDKETEQREVSMPVSQEPVSLSKSLPLSMRLGEKSPPESKGDQYDRPLSASPNDQEIQSEFGMNGDSTTTLSLDESAKGSRASKNLFCSEDRLSVKTDHCSSVSKTNAGMVSEFSASGIYIMSASNKSTSNASNICDEILSDVSEEIDRLPSITCTGAEDDKQVPGTKLGSFVKVKLNAIDKLEETVNICDQPLPKQAGVQVEVDIEVTTADKDTQSSDDNFTLSDEERAFPDPQQPNFDVSRIPLPDECDQLKNRILKARKRKRNLELPESVSPKSTKRCDEKASSIGVQCSKPSYLNRLSSIRSKSCQTHKIKINLKPRNQDPFKMYSSDSQTLMEVVEEVSKVLDDSSDADYFQRKTRERRISSGYWFSSDTSYTESEPLKELDSGQDVINCEKDTKKGKITGYVQFRENVNKPLCDEKLVSSKLTQDLTEKKCGQKEVEQPDINCTKECNVSVLSPDHDIEGRKILEKITSSSKEIALPSNVSEERLCDVGLPQESIQESSDVNHSTISTHPKDFDEHGLHTVGNKNAIRGNCTPQHAETTNFCTDICDSSEFEKDKSEEIAVDSSELKIKSSDLVSDFIQDPGHKTEELSMGADPSLHGMSFNLASSQEVPRPSGSQFFETKSGVKVCPLDTFQEEPLSETNESVMRPVEYDSMCELYDDLHKSEIMMPEKMSLVNDETPTNQTEYSDGSFNEVKSEVCEIVDFPKTSLECDEEIVGKEDKDCLELCGTVKLNNGSSDAMKESEEVCSSSFSEYVELIGEIQPQKTEVCVDNLTLAENMDHKIVITEQERVVCDNEEREKVPSYLEEKDYISSAGTEESFISFCMTKNGSAPQPVIISSACTGSEGTIIPNVAKENTITMRIVNDTECTSNTVPDLLTGAQALPMAPSAKKSHCSIEESDGLTTERSDKNPESLLQLVADGGALGPQEEQPGSLSVAVAGNGRPVMPQDSVEEELPPLDSPVNVTPNSDSDREMPSLQPEGQDGASTPASCAASPESAARGVTAAEDKHAEQQARGDGAVTWSQASAPVPSVAPRKEMSCLDDVDDSSSESSSSSSGSSSDSSDQSDDDDDGSRTQPRWGRGRRPASHANGSGTNPGDDDEHPGRLAEAAEKAASGKDVDVAVAEVAVETAVEGAEVAVEAAVEGAEVAVEAAVEGAEVAVEAAVEGAEVEVATSTAASAKTEVEAEATGKELDVEIESVIEQETEVEPATVVVETEVEPATIVVETEVETTLDVEVYHDASIVLEDGGESQGGVACIEISDIRTVAGDMAEWTGADVVPVPVDSINNWPYVEEVFSSEEVAREEVVEGADEDAEAHSAAVLLGEDDDDMRPQLRCSLSWDRVLQAGEGLVLGPAKIEVRLSDCPLGPLGPFGPMGSSPSRRPGRSRSAGSVSRATMGPWNVVDRDRSEDSMASSSLPQEENNNVLPAPVFKVNRLILKRPSLHSLPSASPPSASPPSCSHVRGSRSPDGGHAFKTKGALKSYQMVSERSRMRRGARRSRGRSRSRSRSRVGHSRRRWYSQLSPASSTPFRSPGSGGLGADWEVPKVIIKRQSASSTRSARRASARRQLDMDAVVVVERDPRLDAMALELAGREDRGPRPAGPARSRKRSHSREEGGEDYRPLQILAEVAEGLLPSARPSKRPSKRRVLDDKARRRARGGEALLEADRQWRPLEATPRGQDTPMPEDAGPWARMLDVPSPSPVMPEDATLPDLGFDEAGGLRVHRCGACGEEVADAERADHVKQHPYRCQRCYLAFASQADFTQHLKVAHPNTQELHHCLLCLEAFPTIQEHAVHMKGSSHCHMERSQRRTIHTLFRMFTGADCPRVSPLTHEDEQALDLPTASDVIHFFHKPTPLQLATEDLQFQLGNMSGRSAGKDT